MALLLHHLVFKPSSVSSSSCSSLALIKPLALSFSLHLHLHKSFPSQFFNSPNSSLHPRFLCTSSSSSSSSSSSVTYPETPSLLQNDDEDDNFEDEFQQLDEDNVEEEEEKKSEVPIKVPFVNNSKANLPTLTLKEKKELASYAHSLGKKLKIQQVGKSGITDSVAASFVENLESNELLKLKIHNSCPGELPDVIKQLEITTGSVAVGQIGRSVILYRPSLTKLKAEEKRREARRMYVRKGLRPRPTELQVKAAQFRSKRNESMERRRPPPNLSSRGRRGRSCNENP